MLPILAIGVITVWTFTSEFPALRKRGLKRELWAFLLLLCLGSGLNLVRAMRLPFKDPLNWLFMLYQPLSDFLYRLLQ